MESKVLILNDIRSVINTGAIFRTADAIGISKIYLTGYTPAPVDRFQRKRSDFAKTALGAEENVAWELFKDADNLLDNLKEDDYTTVALEQSENSVDYKKIELGNKVAVIVGNEVRGIPEELLNKCDVIAEIPMLGQKESLNVSVAAGVFLFRLFDK